MPATILPQAKLATVARVAEVLLAQWDRLPDTRVAEQLLAEGIRKIHDSAESHRGRGKYKGHAYWSRQALDLLNQSNGKLGLIRLQLAHEHVVPVREVIRQLRRLGPEVDSNQCVSVIQEWAVVAIITREQDALFAKHGLQHSMPPDWDGQRKWARYEHVGLWQHITDA